jgi:phospholipid/cholesterol/gamma-HCH transport system ATP-binding protein
VISWFVIMVHRLSPLAEHDRLNDTGTPAVVFDNVSLAFDEKEVLRGLSFVVRVGQMTILLGASGSGKSVVLKLILGLLKPDSGIIHVNGERIDTMTEAQMMKVRGDIGMLFQESALFDSLTVAGGAHALEGVSRHGRAAAL